MIFKMMAFSLIILWGVWGIFEKKTVQYVHPLVAVLYMEIIYAMSIPIYIILLKTNNISFVINKTAIFWGSLNGIVGILASVIVLFVLEKESASWTVSVTAAYPVVTLILSIIFLKENISANAVFGVIFVCIGLFLLNK